MITKDLDGPHGSARYVITTPAGEQVMYEGKEASAISALFARRVSPDVVLDALFGRAATPVQTARDQELRAAITRA